MTPLDDQPCSVNRHLGVDRVRTLRGTAAFRWSRRAGLVAIALAGSLLTGCAATTGPVATDPSNDPSATGRVADCIALSMVAPSTPGEIVLTELGPVSLRDGSLVLTAGAIERVLADGVASVLGVGARSGISTFVYGGETDEFGEAPLRSVSVDGSTFELGVAVAPEFAVTGAEYDAMNDRWVLTSVSDLTEGFTSVPASGESVEALEALFPFEYNRGPFLTAVAADGTGGFVGLLAPEGDVPGWSLTAIATDGRAGSALNWPMAFGEPTGEAQTFTHGGRTWWYVHTQDGRDAVVDLGAITQFGVAGVIVRPCAPVNGRWVSPQS